VAEEAKESIAILDEAIELEEEGRAFYQKAADWVEDPAAKETFRFLAEEEVKHRIAIERQRKALVDEGHWSPTSDLEPAAESFDIEEPIFPDAVKAIEDKFGPRTGEQEAIWFGIEVEQKAYALYQRGARETADPTAKRIFQDLAQAERKHFQLLMANAEVLSGFQGWA
jgi:rubrerythrin